jgi:hypothetical protein
MQYEHHEGLPGLVQLQIVRYASIAGRARGAHGDPVQTEYGISWSPADSFDSIARKG